MNLLSVLWGFVETNFFYMRFSYQKLYLKVSPILGVSMRIGSKIN